MAETIKVLLAEDHTLTRKGLRLLLERSTQIKVLGEAQSGMEVLQKAHELRPDVVLMGVDLKPMDGLTTTRLLQKQLPDIRVLILTIHNDQASMDQALKAGALGYLLKHANESELIEAVKAVYYGNRPIVHRPAKGNGHRCAFLSPREQEVLELLAKGKSIQESADCLKLSPKTIESHRSNLMKKLDIHTIAELTQYAIRVGLIDLDAA